MEHDPLPDPRAEATDEPADVEGHLYLPPDELGGGRPASPAGDGSMIEPEQPS
jgi:hypothetical protein